MRLTRVVRALPHWKNALLAILAAVLLILAFPDFEYWFLAWFGVVPLLLAIDREKESLVRSFLLGWLFGFVFFSGTCWWLTYAPITYAGFPWPLAYFLLFCVTAIAGIFPGLFTLIVSALLRQFGSWAYLAPPFVWVASEFARYWVTGNNWNAIGYSQAFAKLLNQWPAIGGVSIVSFVLLLLNAIVASFYSAGNEKLTAQKRGLLSALLFVVLVFIAILPPLDFWAVTGPSDFDDWRNVVVGVQPNVPMLGLDSDKWKELRQHQTANAEEALEAVRKVRPVVVSSKTTVILPESPMNFQWDEDPEFQQFIKQFAAENNVSVLFNSAEPDAENKKYFNSAVMIDASGREVAEYDKIYLLPFGEAVPVPLESFIPGFVGNFSYGKNYNLVPLGDTKAGIMICFESHFGELSRQYVKNGADAIIEMTNDGYLGPTPVLRQHLANAVFRAIETNRPVLRVTNVGITAYITERGEVLDATQPYTEDTRVWSVAKSDGSQTFYVKYGDWFAWLSSLVTILLLVICVFKRNRSLAAT